MMKGGLWIPTILAIIGIIVLAGGLSVYFIKAETVAACAACGMEVSRRDISTFQILTADGKLMYGCCPICSLAIATYYDDAEVKGLCYRCGKDVSIKISNKELSTIYPNGSGDNVSMIFGKTCIKNKLVCSNECGREILRSESWATKLPIMTIQQAFSTAKTKVPEFKIQYRTVEAPIVAYALIGTGLILLAAAPIWIMLQKRNVQASKDQLLTK